MPVDLLAEGASSGGKDLLGKAEPKDLLAESSDKAPPEETQKSGVLEGVKRGFLERGTGVDQLLNQVGVGGIFPVFTNGKLSFGLPPNEELVKREQALEEQGKGTGLAGTAGEILGDPVTYMPAGKFGKAATWAATGLKEGASKIASVASQGGIQAALSSFLAPTSKEDQKISDRLENAGIATPIGAVTGGILSALGNKIFAAPTGGLTEGSPLYKTLSQIGVKLTGKETPQEVWEKLQTAVKDKVSNIAEQVDKGSSVSDMWPVSVNLATSKMYDATRQAGGVLYKKASAIGDKLAAPAKDLLKDIGALVEDAKGDTLSAGINPKFRTALKKLEDLQEAIKNGVSKEVGEDLWSKATHLLQHGTQPEEKVTGAQLIELDQALNELYGKSGQGGAAGKLYSNLQTKVNDTIKGMSPEFGAAYQKAKDYWKTQVVHNFEENKALQAFWKEEDYQAYKDVQKGLPLHPNVKTRVVEQMDKIKTWNDLDVLKNQLPPEMYATVRAHKVITLMDQMGIDAKVLADDKSYALLSKTLGNKPEELQALDAIKTFAEQMQKRGIKGNVSPSDLQESDKLMDRAVRMLLGFATRHKLYELRHAWDLLKGKTTAETEKGALKRLTVDAAKGSPKSELAPGALSDITSKGATRAAAPEEGEEVSQ